MNYQEAIKNLLVLTLAEQQNKTPSYSQRAFAKRLGLSSSTISEIMNGRRKVTPKIASRILGRINADPLDIESIKKALVKKSNIENVRMQIFTELSNDNLSLISEWHYYAILSLVETDDFVSDIEWIGARLGIRSAVVQSAIDRLIRMGLIKFSKKKIVAANMQLTTTHNIPNNILKKQHYQNLDQMRASLENDPVDMRDFTYIVFAGDPNRMVEMKKWIKDFRRAFCSEFESKNKTEVYKACFGLIPLSKKIKTKERV